MVRRLHNLYAFLAIVAALAAACALSACDIPAAGKPVLYADQEAQAAEFIEAAEAAEKEAAEEGAAAEAQDETPIDDFFPVESVGEGVISLRLENHLGTTVTSVSIRPTGTDDWPEETTYAGLSIPNGAQFELRVSDDVDESLDIRYEGSDGTTFLAIGCKPVLVALDHMYNDIIYLRYDRGITYLEYTNLQGFRVDTRLGAQEALAAMRAQLESRGETFTFTERDMEGVEAGQETENCLD